MDPSVSPQPTFELPGQGAPSPESAGQPAAVEAPLQPSQERLANPGNVPSASPLQPVTQAATSVPLPAAPQMAPPLPQPAVSATTNMTASDAELIEKEWVTKAKAIVGSTSTDPYTQNKEISKVKADYLKKRYNKDLPVTEK